MSETENPAEVLREAAALMRSRAEKAAAASPLPWYHAESTGLAPFRSEAEHIAGMTPSVALDIAKMLDAIADNYAIASHGYWSILALNVARTYLGRP